MPNIRVNLAYTIKDGTEVNFRSPADCSAVTGLIVYYPAPGGVQTSKEFVFADAHGNNVGDIDHLFAEDVVVKVILDVTTGMAFVQNADTNSYIEKTFVKVADVGNKEEAFALDILSHDEGIYFIDGEPTGTGENRHAYTFAIPDTLRNKTITIKTYMYGDMHCAFVDSSGKVIASTIQRNYFANVPEEPKSGIYEMPIDVTEFYHTLRVSFEENPYMEKPEVYEVRGTVWEEIKRIENDTGDGDTVTLDDYVIEQGHDVYYDGAVEWKWRKWASGVAEIWGSIEPNRIDTTELMGESFIELPFIIWAGDMIELPVPTVTYSVDGVYSYILRPDFDPHYFECDVDCNEDGDVINVNKTGWNIPCISFYEEMDGILVPSEYTDYTVDVHMVGRWKPVGDDSSNELIAIKGEDGHTPVKGVDYFTEDDVSKMVSQVIAALPVYDGEVV